jgi:hypothetical protein
MAQLQTGSIAGIASDTSGGVLPGVSVTLSGEKLIGGVQSAVTDATGAYRFDRLPPGSYRVKFELAGFKTVERDGIMVSAAFVANVTVKLEVGQMTETVTVMGQSPTVDTKSNVQQTVMTQDILEGVPTGRDPWSVAKIIPGVAISVYDVGGTQSSQQSSLSSHGSSVADVTYNIDGASVNWPGSNGGLTQMYFDQGMFEEVNYLTSAIPAEVMAGGITINMVTKDAGNKWRGDARVSGAVQKLQSVNTTDPSLPAGFLGNPVKNLYDVNVGGGGALVQDRLWLNGSIRRWVVNKYVNARNPDGSQALDDNEMENYSGKAVYSASQNHKFAFSVNHSGKTRGHYRNTPPDIMTDIASLYQTNPGTSAQAKYTGLFQKLVYESSFSLMKGQGNYMYQPGTPSTAIRAIDSTLDTANFAAFAQEFQPCSRLVFDNMVSYSKPGWWGDHLFKGGVQFLRQSWGVNYSVLNDLYLNYNDNKAVSVTEFNTPSTSENIEDTLGAFFQDTWTVANRLTLNLGVRFDHNVGTIPAESTTGGQFVGPESFPESTPIRQNLPSWRTGLVWDVVGNGSTALKASWSRYGLQVGIDRLTNVNPLTVGSRTCPWTDPTPGGGTTEPSLATVLTEINTSECTAFPTLSVHYASPNGPRWPYSDELTAGIERQVLTDMRLAVMYYRRTNRDQIGEFNTAVPPSDYVPVTVTIPNGPSGPMTATVYNLSSPALVHASNLVLDNASYLDTTYNGIEITASKRMTHRWQMVAGLTVGENKGGLNTGALTVGQSSTVDLNNPNNTYGNGAVGYDSKMAFRLSGSYVLPKDFTVAGTMISNGGFPYVSTYTVTRAKVPSLVLASQTVYLSDRGDERLPTVTMVDLRLSRPFRFAGNRSIVPQVEVFNVGNSSAIVGLNSAVGGTYLVPNAIVAPRLVRFGISVDF